MREQILINSVNYVTPNRYVYKFPRPVRFNKNSKVSLYSFSMYNSTYNISSALNNYTFSVIWINNITYNFIIPDGYYSYTDLDNFLSYNNMVHLGIFKYFDDIAVLLNFLRNTQFFLFERKVIID